MKNFRKSMMMLVITASVMFLNACDLFMDHRQIDELSVLETELEFEADGELQLVEVNTNARSWSATTSVKWITIDEEADGFYVSVDEYTETNRDRTGRITVKAGEATPVTIIVTQLKNESYNDKDWVKLQSATVGKGINIVLMGDGYTMNDMRKRTGKYEQEMREAAGHFFSVQPYIRYRDHFNVYMVVAVSNQEGVSVESPAKKADTKFSTTWEGGNSTGLDCNKDMAFQYVDAIKELSSVHFDDITVILPINADFYAGTCWSYYPQKTYGNGSGASISLCPVSRSFKGSIGGDFRAVVLHEAGGHGFAKLADEYIYYNTTITAEEKSKMLNFKNNFGWRENIDVYGNISNTSWSGFAGKSKYNMVSPYEGANYYAKGVWRPENNSCMNDNVAYFNAPSRWAQVNRIKKLAGLSYTFAQFLQEDVIPEYPSGTRVKSAEEFVPLAPPVVLENLPIRSNN